MATPWIYKPVSDKASKGAVLLTPTKDQPPVMTLPDGTTIVGVPADQRGGEFLTEHGYQWSFGQDPLGQKDIQLSYGGQTVTINGGQSYEGSSMTGWSPRAKGSTSEYGGTGTYGNGEQLFTDQNGNVLAVAPQFADYSKLDFERLVPGQAEFAPIEGVDPIDVLGRATEVGAYNTSQILDNFVKGREIASGNFDFTKDRVAEVNEFQREQAQDRLAGTPEADRILTNSLRNLEAFSQGRVSDPVLNEQMNANTRAMQAANSNAVGGGATSSFGNRVGNDLNLSQRLGLQKDAINVAPSFISNALEIRNGKQQNLEFDPMSIERAAQVLTSANTLDPAQALNFDFQNQSNELNTQRFNAELDANEQRFNITNDFEAQRYNSSTQLEVDLTKLQAEQFQYSTLASLQNSTINATRADNRFNELLGIQAQGIEDAQAAGDVNAFTTAVTGFLGTLATLGVGSGIISAIKGALGVGDDSNTQGNVNTPPPGTNGSGGNGIDAPNATRDYRAEAADRLSNAGNIELPNGRRLSQTPQWENVLNSYEAAVRDGVISRAEINRITNEINSAMQDRIPGAAQYEPIAIPGRKPNNDNSINDDVVDNIPTGGGDNNPNVDSGGNGNPNGGWEIGGQD